MTAFARIWYNTCERNTEKEEGAAMSITLSIPPAIVQEVREWAEANGTSLNAFVRECLEAKCKEIAESRKRLAREFIEFAKTHTAHVPTGWKFNRERDGHRETRIRT